MKKNGLLAIVFVLCLLIAGCGETVSGYPAFDFEKKDVILNSGYEMPILGLGMFSLSDSQVENSTYWALKAGFRLIDTARIYGNEAAVGRGNTQTLFNDETISSIAAAHGVSSAQVIIRWHLQAGNICIPGSSNEQHIIEDYDVWDFELIEEEMNQMTALERDKRFVDY